MAKFRNLHSIAGQAELVSESMVSGQGGALLGRLEDSNLVGWSAKYVVLAVPSISIVTRSSQTVIGFEYNLAKSAVYDWTSVEAMCNTAGQAPAITIDAFAKKVFNGDALLASDHKFKAGTNPLEFCMCGDSPTMQGGSGYVVMALDNLNWQFNASTDGITTRPGDPQHYTQLKQFPADGNSVSGRYYNGGDDCHVLYFSALVPPTPPATTDGFNLHIEFIQYDQNGVKIGKIPVDFDPDIKNDGSTPWP